MRQFKTLLRTYDAPRVMDPDKDPDPAFFPLADPDPGFDDQKLKKIYSWKLLKKFLIKNCNLLMPRPSLRTPRRILQSSKENIRHFKT
jgi:hypothetical protein